MVSMVALAAGQNGGIPPKLVAGHKRLVGEGERNSVLNCERLAVDAMQLGCGDLAKDYLDRALARIGAVYADNPGAQKARSLWYEEGCKDFKGEPYERSMAYYYRGLLYLMDGDYDNGRACFKSGVLQDAFAEEEQNRCDFALLVFLEAWACAALGDSDLADAAYAELGRLRPDFLRPSAEANVLLIVETGKSPRKLADGMGHSELKFRRGRDFSEVRARYSLDGTSSQPLYPMEDVAWQAMTRGGRQVDNILQGKVQFRSSNERSGTVLTDIASEMLLRSPGGGSSGAVMDGVGAALGLVGVVQLALSASTKPRADTRYWDNLPDAVHVAALTLPAGKHDLVLSYCDASGQQVSESNVSVSIPDAGVKRIVWARSRTQLSTAK